MGEPQTSDDQPTVLVVDDDPEAVDLYAECLADEYTVRTACSGEEALAAVDPAVDIVLLDRRMPGLSGDDVLKRIRARGVDCRVVLVTAVDPDLDVLGLPFDDYLVKPVSRETIRDVVSRMLVRNTYDETIREVVTLVSRMATLESKLPIRELEASAEYAALEARFDELRAETGLTDPEDEVYVEFTTEKIRTLFG